MFDSCQGVLQERLEQAIGARIQRMEFDLDPVAGISTLVITLA
jgi:hypothetical protein